MSNEEKERRCKSCGKLLLDEKLPFCRRCVLEGKNKIVQVGGIVVGAAITVGTVNSLSQILFGHHFCHLVCLSVAPCRQLNGT